jgi:Carbohydrate esterase, sialic acid-specific acetylesterase
VVFTSASYREARAEAFPPDTAQGCEFLKAHIALGSALFLVAGFMIGIWFEKQSGTQTLLTTMGLTRFEVAARKASTRDSEETGLPDHLYATMSLFILAGQSNMSGRGDLPASPETHPRIFMFGNDYRWRLAREPVDDPEGQVDVVSKDESPDPAGFGPGMSFALAVAEKRADSAIGLIPCAKGDTTIHEWRRSLNDSTLYGSCLKRVKAVATAGEVEGLLFFQGEADALAPDRQQQRIRAPGEYAVRFSAFVRDLRTDLALPHLPVVFAQIGTQTAPLAFTQWEVVREQQRAVRLSCSAMIATEDLPLRDTVHFTTASYGIIGGRFAAAYLNLIDSPDCAGGRIDR